MENHSSDMEKTGFAVPDANTLIETNRICNRFILTSFFYLFFGVTLGALHMARIFVLPSAIHTHLNLVGFVCFLIFGVAYKMMPTMFFGKVSVWSLPLARIHFYVANIGIVGMTIFWIGYALRGGMFLAPLAVSGFVELVGFYMFIYNMARTYWG